MRSICSLVALVKGPGWVRPKKIVSDVCSPRNKNNQPNQYDVISFGDPEKIFKTTLTFTLPETNIASENRPSQTETNLPTIHSQGLC